MQYKLSFKIIVIIHLKLPLESEVSTYKNKHGSLKELVDGFCNTLDAHTLCSYR